jgi:hypothetical protein
MRYSVTPCSGEVAAGINFLVLTEHAHYEDEALDSVEEPFSDSKYEES